MAQCYYSPQWAPREAALRRVEVQLRNTPSEKAERRVFTYAVFMLEAALSDKVSGVLWGGLSLLRTLIASYAKDLSPLEVPFPLRSRPPPGISPRSISIY
eukprot:COSAG05_NODE_2326_length_3231_cov_38.996096_1_plen_99_part_10